MYERVKHLIRKTKGMSVSNLLYSVFVEYPICNVLRNLHFLLLRRGRKLVVCRVQGSLMELDLHDRGISRDLFQFGVRERTSTSVMQEILHPGMTVVDIGANIGYYALMEAASGASCVYALEPVPDNFQRLCRNIMLNGYRSIWSFPLAVGYHAGKASMVLSEKSNLHSICDAEEDEGMVSVEMVTLDGFLQGKPVPDVVRMDVEGYEYEILCGMSQTLRRMKQGSWLFIEVHDLGGVRAAAVLERVADAGFLLHRSVVECKENRLFSYRTYREKFPGLVFPRSGVMECFFQKKTQEDDGV